MEKQRIASVTKVFIQPYSFLLLLLRAFRQPLLFNFCNSPLFQRVKF